MRKLCASLKGHLTMTHRYIWLRDTVIQCASKDLYRLMPIYGLKIALDLQPKDLWPMQDFGTGWKTSELAQDRCSCNALPQSETMFNRTKQEMLWSCHFQRIFWDKFSLSKISRLYSIKLYITAARIPTCKALVFPCHIRHESIFGAKCKTLITACDNLVQSAI